MKQMKNEQMEELTNGKLIQWKTWKNGKRKMTKMKAWTNEQQKIKWKKRKMDKWINEEMNKLTNGKCKMKEM